MSEVLPVLPSTLTEVMEWRPSKSERAQAIRLNYLRGAESYLVVGCLLRQSKNAGDWKSDMIAHNFWEWVEKEMLISKSNGLRMVAIWDSVKPYLKKHQAIVLQVGFTKLAEIAPIIKGMDEQKALEWLHIGATNNAKDLKANIAEYRGRIPADECDHEWEPWNRCVKCGKFEKGV